MRKKFTYLISLAAAMICSSSGVAWGQTYWDSGWDCDGGTTTGICLAEAKIDGNRWYRWVTLTGTNKTATATDCGTNQPTWTISSPPSSYDWYSYNSSGVRYKQRCTCSSSNYTDGSGTTYYKWSWSVDGATIDGTANLPTYSLYPSTGITWLDGSWYTTAPTHTIGHGPIVFNTLASVQSNLVYASPHWYHFHASGVWSETTGSFTWTKDFDDDPVTTGEMITTNSGLRLTGAANQITAAGSTLTTKTLTFQANRLLFDQDWDANFNGVDPSWNPLTATATGSGTLGFYSGTGAVTKSGDTLLLGPCATRDITINTDITNLVVNSYTHGVFTNGLDCDETVSSDPSKPGTGNGIVYNDSASYCYGNGLAATTTISANQLEITNKWGGCWAVNFPQLFKPTFSGGGRLLINPNVANFNAGVELTTAQAGNVDIWAKKTSTTGNFLYKSTGSGNLHVKMNIPQSPDCGGCGYFSTTEVFTTDISGATAGSVLIEDDNITGYVNVGGSYTHKAKPTLASSHKVNVNGSISVGDTVKLDAAGQDVIEFTSASSAIHFGDAPTDYFYYENTGNGSLLVQANGECDGTVCALGGGDVLFSGPVSTIQVPTLGTGFVNIESTKSGVTLNEGLYSEAFHTPFTINGNSYVEIKNPYSGSKTVPSASGSTEGVYIKREGDGNDTIESPHGHVHVQFPLTYGQTVAASIAPFSGLTIDAEGNCGGNCNGVFAGGFVALDSAVTTWNTADGYVKIFAGKTSQADDQYVRMQTGYVHHGEDGNLIVSGHNYVDIQGLYPTPAGSPLAGTPFSGLTLAQTAYVQTSTPDNTTNYGVYIDRKGDGMDSIVSRAGHVWVENPFTYIQASTNTNNTNGLRIWAMGKDCDGLLCTADALYNPNGDRGYVWIGGDFWTINDAYGHTTVVSDSQSVIMDSTMYHFGEKGDLNILASATGHNDCVTRCEDYYPDDMLKGSGAGITDSRGYVWIGGPVNIIQDATGIAGNAVIRSYRDIVEMDDSVMFTDVAEGANLWVIGTEGVRTLGPTHGFNNAFNDAGDGSSFVDGEETSRTALLSYSTSANQGYVTYLSDTGFVDFGLMTGHTYNGKTAGYPRTDEWYANAPAADPNYPFNYTGKLAENALLIEGHSRVFFGDSTTIKMNEAGLAGANNGDAKIYSPAGWIMFGDTVGYTGFAGNLNIYAGQVNNMEQDSVSYRSCMNPKLTCYKYGGFVLFDSITNIEVKDKGVTWIRSNNDDVVMSDVFAYTNTANDDANGEFIMQAGQDIYGRNVNSNGHNNDGNGNNTSDFNDSIKFVQHGNKSILMEAKKTIHLQQKLVFDREEAKKGDITLKAGYPTFAGDEYNGAATMISQAADNNETTPIADLDTITTRPRPRQAWESGDCAPNNYVARFGCNDALINHFDGRNVTGRGSMKGGDIWLENHVFFDLSQTTDNEIPVTLRAFNSIFIDSTMIYTNVGHSVTRNTSDILLFAETGNVEAAVTRQNEYGRTKLKDASTNGYIADDSVVFNLDPTFASELRIQAGNQVWGKGNIDSVPTFESTCWNKGCDGGAEFDGNILFNKPLNIHNQGTSDNYTILSAARDIETQIMAPFTFDYTMPTAANHGDLKLTSGRHIETHAKMLFNYDKLDEIANITMEAGRLTKTDLSNRNGIDSLLCKAHEYGTTLTSNGTDPFDPDVETGGVNGSKNNAFAEGGSGNGSILMFDSVEFNYKGTGTIYMKALNGNIESDPYLHREIGKVANPGFSHELGNAGDGYVPYTPYLDPLTLVNASVLQHDAQLTFNHYGEGLTMMRAIQIKLHDKVAYLGHSNSNKNGDFLMMGYDSVLTRNIQYENFTDGGSVSIITDKYKKTNDQNDCSGNKCPSDVCNADGNGAIQQGHIVLGYGADYLSNNHDRENMNDSVIFNFIGNQNTIGANVLIEAGLKGYDVNKTKGKVNSNRLFNYNSADRGKAYGGNITFDYMKVDMAKGNHTAGGFMKIHTPNGNIWGKDSINYHGMYGDLLVDAGVGSLEDYDAIRWSAAGNEASGIVNKDGTQTEFTANSCPQGSESSLNTNVPNTCTGFQWRTGNIMMKGGTLNFGDAFTAGTVGTGNAIFRTREGFIDTYDAFTVDSMGGDLLKYAGMDVKSDSNQWGDVSERDFQYTPVQKSGSIFYGADDNIMMNYGYSNEDVRSGVAYNGRNQFLFDAKNGNAYELASDGPNPYYSTTYKQRIDARFSVYNVNRSGYMWYRTAVDGVNIWKNDLHLLYRTCHDTQTGTASCSPATGECKTVDNHARDLYFNFDVDAHTLDIESGGLGMVAMNYIDMFTKFTYFGGEGSGMGSVPGMTTLNGEGVQGYGLYMKSLSLVDGKVNSRKVEERRATCENCDRSQSRYMGAWDEYEAMNNHEDLATYEWTYIGFHDDARIYTQDQKGLIEAPVVEFFGHAELNPYKAPTNSANTHGSGKLTVKGDSLIFHDSAIFDGQNLELLPYTTDANRRANDMRYGVINDRGGNKNNVKYYRVYGKAISMEDRNTPVIELGYQRCNEPKKAAWNSPNQRSSKDKENIPYVGGDIIVTCRDGYEFPIFNTIVANHARISFISDSIDSDGTPERNVVDAYIRTDLLRIRNNVEFYDDPTDQFRRGTLKMTSLESMPSVHEPGIFPHHLHMEPGSELSIPGEDSLFVEMTTTVGGYGNIHEDIKVMPGGTIAPGLSSLMEGDCQTSYFQGKLTIHNLKIEPNGIFRISIGDDNMTCWNEYSQEYNGQCTQTDTLVVEDTIDMREKVYLKVLPKTEHVDEGCYLFLVYGDSTGISKEYVKNLVLDPNSLKYDDKYFGLDFSEPGKVYLCVTAFPMPDIQRYVSLPAVTGVTTTPSSGKNYVKGNQNFTFTASYAGAPLKVTAEGYYSHELRDLDYTAVVQPDGSYLYTIYQVVEPWTVQIGPEASTVGNEAIDGQRVWAYKNTLHINVDKSDIVSIYNLTGVLYKRVEVPEGNSKFTLDRGMYVVTLKDGSVYKIVIK